MKESSESKPDDLSFEEALESLELLIEQVESGEIGLEEAIAQYERGAALVKRCRSVLDSAEKRIAELTAGELGDRVSGFGSREESEGEGRPEPM